ncbi:MAG: hypothetical protein IKH45_05395 [Neisseriaceae bacterium]|nr:hypothetical protein [Neisseriaceae bacterium]MBR3482302.1 hypothetical protein [Neisseriaceae bacterium]
MMKFDITLYDEDQIACNVCVDEYLNPFSYLINFILANLVQLGISAFLLIILANFIELDHRLFLLIFCVVFFNVFSFYSKYKHRRTIEINQKNEVEMHKKYGKVYEPNFTVEFLENELTVNNHHISMRYPYADIAQILSDEKHFFIQFDIFHTIMLPIRCLNGQEKELAEFLEKKVPKNIYKKPKFNSADKSSQGIDDNPYAPPKS